MSIVKGQIKYNTEWKDEWIPDIQYWTYLALGSKDKIKVEVEPPKVSSSC